MAVLQWAALPDRTFETGVRHGVLYPMDDSGAYPRGVAWSGLTSVKQSPEGAEPTPTYADDMEYLTLISPEKFKATISAVTYPDEFEECDGSKPIASGFFAGQQTRRPFALTYKTRIGNAVSGVDYGYKLHFIYNAVAAPSERSYDTINESPEPITFSWNLTTTGVEVGIDGFRPSSHFWIDSTAVETSKLQKVLDVIYGSKSADAKLPPISELAALIGREAIQTDPQG